MTKQPTKKQQTISKEKNRCARTCTAVSFRKGTVLQTSNKLWFIQHPVSLATNVYQEHTHGIHIPGTPEKIRGLRREKKGKEQKGKENKRKKISGGINKKKTTMALRATQGAGRASRGQDCCLLARSVLSIICPGGEAIFYCLSTTVCTCRMCFGLIN